MLDVSVALATAVLMLSASCATAAVSTPVPIVAVSTSVAVSGGAAACGAIGAWAMFAEAPSTAWAVEGELARLVSLTCMATLIVLPCSVAPNTTTSHNTQPKCCDRRKVGIGLRGQCKAL